MTTANHDSKAAARAVPVTVLTGFLGSGKTTLLNHLLSFEHGLRVGVIVNEFGAISIDDKLITSRSEDLIELANGCVCCTMQGDLFRALRQIVESDNGVDYILIETTGLADPLPIARTLMGKEMGDRFRLDGILTVVDAANFDKNLEYAEVAFNQLVNGDIILINKIDLVDAQTPRLIENGIRKINGSAEFLECTHGVVDPRILLDIDASDLSSVENVEHRSVAEDGHAPDHAHVSRGHGPAEIESIALEYEQPIDARKFQTFMVDAPEGVLRGKGILNVADDDCRRIFHLVGDRCVVTVGDPWSPGESRKTELVFIGRQLNRSELSGRLSACLA